jgi:ubiquinone/menaquinone biosynthesis C-methylase UbiE
MADNRDRVCPVELASSLDNKVRRWLQNPNAIVAPFVKEGMTVLDMGCGPGFFSVELAKLVGVTGKVIAVDLQEGMLQKVRNKVRGTALEERITLVKCDAKNVNVSTCVDFILVFYMAHEVPDKVSLFRQLRAVLNAGGCLLLVEPKLFHVSKKDFRLTTGLAEANGFTVSPGPKLRFSWSAELRPI